MNLELTVVPAWRRLSQRSRRPGPIVLAVLAMAFAVAATRAEAGLETPSEPSSSRQTACTALADATACRTGLDTDVAPKRTGQQQHAERVADRLAALKRQRVAEGFRCSDEVPGWGCPDLADQLARGDVLKGVYAQCGVVRGRVAFNGAWLKGTACGGKAALIARDGAVIENVRISHVSVGANGACVRWEGGAVTLSGMTCHDSEMGVLGNGQRLVIEDSTIRDSLPGPRPNLGHLVYTCSNRADGAELVVRRTRIVNAGNSGHLLKSGCAVTRVEDSRIDGGDRAYSRLIDAFNGGRLEVRGSTLRVGAHGGNRDLIGYGAEMRQRHPVNTVELSGGAIDCSATWIVNSLHVWPWKLSPSAVSWQPGEARGCPPPSN